MIILAMASFPWHLLPAFQSAGCDIDPDSNGIHVHVSRAAFATPSHLYRWMKLIYRNQADCLDIARRDSGQWAGFATKHRRGHLDHIKIRKGMRMRYGDEYRYDPTGERYSAINTTNDATLEVRIFASTLNVADAQSALQLVAASVEYTRGLRAADVCQHDGWSWAEFGAWVQLHRATYGALARAMELMG